MNYRKLERSLSRFFAVRGTDVAPSDREVQHYLKRMRNRGIVITVRGVVFYEFVNVPPAPFRSRRMGAKHA